MSKIYSVATIKAPEFIEIKEYSPLISKCEIKVLYLGANDNGSFISKDAAIKMARTLPGCPIVGAFLDKTQDFGDHGDVITIEDGEIKFSCKTMPYGFIDLTSKVWFKEFEEENRAHEIVKREYLMVEGYLWTEQYQETKRILEKGNGQSMELDEKTLDGEWSKIENKEFEFFIINDAMFSKLCILGEAVEPCFEGASIAAPNISKDFSLQKTLYTMLNELKFALQGGTEMQEKESMQTEEFAQNQSEDEKNKNQSQSQSQSSEENSKAKDEEEYVVCAPKTEHPDDDKKKYELLQQEIETLKAVNQELLAFKTAVELEKKQAMIDSFYMLSDEDKKDVVTNINSYSIDDIEAKLSIICVRNKVNFNLEAENEVEVEQPLTYSLDAGGEDNSMPAWAKAVIARRKGGN